MKQQNADIKTLGEIKYMWEIIALDAICRAVT